MFSLSFGEMLVIAMVCLVVVGPRRLPEMARFCGHLFGRVNRQASSLRREIRREMQVEDLRAIKEDAERAAREAEQAVYDTGRIADKPSVRASQD